MLYPGLIRKYRDYLPVAEASVITLHEGNTPLFASAALENGRIRATRVLYRAEWVH